LLEDGLRTTTAGTVVVVVVEDEEEDEEEEFSATDATHAVRGTAGGSSIAIVTGTVPDVTVV
jgi:hypothetical protein